MVDIYEAEFIGEFDFRIVRKTAGNRKKRIYAVPKPGEAQKIICKVFRSSNYSMDREHSVAMFVRGKNLEIMGCRMVNSGTTTTVSNYPASIIRDAVYLGADMIVLAHNHPGGDVIPSDTDIQSARAMKDALRIADITLIDFMVIDPETGKSKSALNPPKNRSKKVKKMANPREQL